MTLFGGRLQKGEWTSAIVAAFLVLFGHALTRHSGPPGSGAEALWPGSAVLLGLLVTGGNGRNRVLAILGGGATGLLAWCWWDGAGVLGTLTRLVGTVGASLAAFALLSRYRDPDLFARPSGVLALVSAGAAASVIPAVLALFGRVDGQVLLATFGAHFLGLLVLTPAVVILVELGRGRTGGRLAQRGVLEIAGLMAAVAGVSGAVFALGSLPLLFAITPAVLLATYRLRAPGAVGAVAIVAVIATYALGHGQGPIAVADTTPANRLLIQQLFLACCFLVALPAAAVLAERDRRAGEARALADRFRTVVENIGEVIFLLDGAGRWAYLNPAWEVLSGIAVSHSVGRSWLERIEPGDRDMVARHAALVLAGTAPAFRQTLRFQGPDGIRWVELFLEPLRDTHGQPAGATGTLRDVDERKRLEDHAHTARRNAEQRAREATVLASTDELTGIANRRAFLQQLDREIEASIEYGWPLAVALFDVDHFKLVNDRYGHAVGDRVLQHIAQRAVASVRGGDLVGRLGGEEFAILMPGSSAQEAAIVAERLRRAVQAATPEPAPLPCVTVSIGIAQREDQRTAEALLATADGALYTAKDEGRNRIRVAA